MTISLKHNSTLSSACCRTERPLGCLAPSYAAGGRYDSILFRNCIQTLYAKYEMRWYITCYIRTEEKSLTTDTYPTARGIRVYYKFYGICNACTSSCPVKYISVKASRKPYTAWYMTITICDITLSSAQLVDRVTATSSDNSCRAFWKAST